MAPKYPWVSIKENFIVKLESQILSGRFEPGSRLPSERDLAGLFHVSRPVVHEAMRALEARGLVAIAPRKGITVNDFRKDGSLEVLVSIMNYTDGKLSKPLFDGLMEMRMLFETEIARCAARLASHAQIEDLRGIVEAESAKKLKLKEMVALDFSFHHVLAIASGNPIYSLLINSFKGIYGSILQIFYQDAAIYPKIISLHRKIVDRVAARDVKGSGAAMEEILVMGEKKLRMIMKERTGSSAKTTGKPVKKKKS